MNRDLRAIKQQSPLLSFHKMKKETPAAIVFEVYPPVQAELDQILRDTSNTYEEDDIMETYNAVDDLENRDITFIIIGYKPTLDGIYLRVLSIEFDVLLSSHDSENTYDALVLKKWVVPPGFPVVDPLTAGLAHTGWIHPKYLQALPDITKNAVWIHPKALTEDMEF